MDQTQMQLYIEGLVYQLQRTADAQEIRNRIHIADLLTRSGAMTETELTDTLQELLAKMEKKTT